MTRAPDVIIIGSGMGGATLAAALAPSGKCILILERGERIADDDKNHDAAYDVDAIFKRGHFRPHETWRDETGAEFNPGNYYYVGGNSKFYGGVLLRYRAQDFSPLTHIGGTTPGWPLTYEDIEPWYQAAEEMYCVRGVLGEDPTEPHHSGGYSFPPVPDEPAIATFRRRLKNAGLNPSSLPLGVNLNKWLARAKIPWDAFPDTRGDGKMDAEGVGIAHALKYPNVKLVTGAHVDRLHVGAGGRIESIAYRRNSNAEKISASTVALAAGAVNTAAILLRSTDERYPNGLANTSDQVGRNFMNHNTSAVLAIDPWRRNNSVYQKTLQVNDFYLFGGPGGKPLGNVQLLGKISGSILASQTRLPLFVANWIATHSIDLYAISEELPVAESRVTIKSGGIVLNWKHTNLQSHKLLVSKLKRVLRRSGYPIVLSRPFDRRTPSHQCGTARMSADPRTGVVDVNCRSYDHANLFITDASVLPTSAAVNPGLTVIALALRCAEHIKALAAKESA